MVAVQEETPPMALVVAIPRGPVVLLWFLPILIVSQVLLEIQPRQGRPIPTIAEVSVMVVAMLPVEVRGMS